MMFSVALDTKGFDTRLAQIAINIGHLPDTFLNALQGQQGKLANKALARLTTVPGQPIYPIRWASQKQRRAFFATNGFGKGIPSRRNYTLLKAWHVVVVRTDGGGYVSLVNETSYMKFVQGDDVQPFHLDTGWVQRADVVDDYVRETSEQVKLVWFTAARAAVETTKT